MSIFDKTKKAMDKVEESIGEAREKAGLAPDHEPEVSSETDPGKASTPQADDTSRMPE
jgi:hypothetical protein